MSECHDHGVPVEAWERRADVPLTLLACAFLVAYAWPIINPDLDTTLRNSLEVASWSVWAAFAVDLAVRVLLARGRRLAYLAQRWYDVALVALPAFRPLRLLRLVALIRILDRSVASSLAGRMVVYVAGVAAMSLGLGALAVLDAERGAEGANILSLGDALWWAATTVTTVGYGDRYPVTVEGRLVALLLMLVGIGLVGTVTALARLVARWQGG